MTQEFASSIAPADITGCEERSPLYIRVTLAHAVQCTLKAQYRLLRVASAGWDAERQKAWDAGPEKTWFDAYDARKLAKIKETFDRIGDILGSPRLKVVCDPNFLSPRNRCLASAGSGWAAGGSTSIRKIAANGCRPSSTKPHILPARSVAKESPWYGKSGAKKMAAAMQAKRPMMVTRSAENHGYYAIEVAAAFGVYLWA